MFATVAAVEFPAVVAAVVNVSVPNSLLFFCCDRGLPAAAAYASVIGLAFAFDFCVLRSSAFSSPNCLRCSAPYLSLACAMGSMPVWLAAEDAITSS